MHNFYVAAIRGRYKNGKIRQQLEISSQKSMHTITTVWKDNVIVDFEKLNNDEIKVRNNTHQGYLIAKEGDGVYTSITSKRGTVQKKRIQTLTTRNDKGVVVKIDGNLRIRKLTPKETWRLMGFTDADFEKAEKVNSNTQLFQQAGNSIAVNCLEAIFKNLLL